MSLAGYKRHQAAEAGPSPLSREEEEMLEIKQAETRVEISVDSKQATLASLQFPFDKAALQAIETFWRGGHSYIQLGIGESRWYPTDYRPTLLQTWTPRSSCWGARASARWAGSQPRFLPTAPATTCSDTLTLTKGRPSKAMVFLYNYLRNSIHESVCLCVTPF